MGLISIEKSNGLSEYHWRIYLLGEIYDVTPLSISWDTTSFSNQNVRHYLGESTLQILF